MTRKLLNIVAFQACWFACVLGAANAMPWLGPLLTAAWLAVHLASLGPDAAREWRVLTAAALLGWLADSALVLSGLIAFPEFTHLGGPSPVWMVALWVGFAATLRHALGWLRGHGWLGAVLGAVGGPLAYAGGEALGAITLHGAPALAAVAAQYAIATPLLLALIRYLERDPEPAAARPAPEVGP